MYRELHRDWNYFSWTPHLFDQKRFIRIFLHSKHFFVIQNLLNKRKRFDSSVTTKKSWWNLQMNMRIFSLFDLFEKAIDQRLISFAFFPKWWSFFNKLAHRNHIDFDVVMLSFNRILFIHLQISNYHVHSLFLIHIPVRS